MRKLIITHTLFLLIVFLLDWSLSYFSVIDLNILIFDVPFHLGGLTVLCSLVIILISALKKANQKDNSNSILSLIFIGAIIIFCAELLFQIISFLFEVNKSFIIASKELFFRTTIGTGITLLISLFIRKSD